LPPRLRRNSLSLLRHGLLASLGTVASVQAQTTGTLIIEADRLQGRTGHELVAQGRVELRRDTLLMKADRLEYDATSQRSRSEGHVMLLSSGNEFSGPQLDLFLGTDPPSGRMEAPRYRFARTQAGGLARSIEFSGQNKITALGATYSSCPAPTNPDDDLPWVLTTRRIDLDFAANEGLAEGAVLRFQGVPILALPLMSFPVTQDRKSGWLPPTVNLSNTSGFEIGVPYYWNIAPNYDATLTPTISSKRGAGYEGEFRYLGSGWRGQFNSTGLPSDRISEQSRWATRWSHRGEVDRDWHYQIRTLRVSDDAYWQDGLRGAENWTPRLLQSQADLERHDFLRLGAITVDQQFYARAQQWQVLQSNLVNANITAPYRRWPQVGMRWHSRTGALESRLETEANRFVHDDPTQLQGNRLHAQGSLAWHFGDEGWEIQPRLGFNAAHYQLDSPLADGSLTHSRTIPTFSLDNHWTFERPVSFDTLQLTQTLEPRLMYVRTPWRDQSLVPNFDSAPLDFNAATVFATNTFSGVDRVSDADQITAGLSSRWLRGNGAEIGRIDLAQRLLLQPQVVTADGQPLTRRYSDQLLAGSLQPDPSWGLEASVQRDPEISRIARSMLSARYSPGPFRTVSAIYRLQRGTSEQVALGWQWPIADLARSSSGPASSSSQDCRGTLYGVGRLDYSMLDERVTGLIGGLEYDAGCWIGRIVAQHQSTQINSATTQLMIQLELVGLSRLGTNPLALLKSSVPGYRLLRESPQDLNASGAPSLTELSPSPAPAFSAP
jgi:LPS-assembly protein